MSYNMFTGIIEELGTVTAFLGKGEMARLKVQAKTVLADLEVGSSIAVDGVCLTVAELKKGSFSADLSAETLKRTTLKRLQPGSRVNLERPLRFGKRLGGHLVLGHVDGVGCILEMRAQGDGYLFRFSYPPELEGLLVFKGSIAVDGISLTVAGLHAGAFDVAIIPYTFQVTTLGVKKVGDPVNLEADILGKYVKQQLQAMDLLKQGIDLTFLKTHGFA
ncbi:MAG: riboflavin synthase [Candidatus Methylomirabilales bacterium]